MPLVFIAPSILSADFTRLGDEIRDAETGGADWIHVDVMDGRFVPNITMGPLIVESVRKSTSKFIEACLRRANIGAQNEWRSPSQRWPDLVKNVWRVKMGSAQCNCITFPLHNNATLFFSPSNRSRKIRRSV